jgi:KaiC/GvpD/RAD55 family RecA-like ATPase
MNEVRHRFFNEMRTIGMDFDSLEKSEMFSYIDATGLRRIPHEAKVGRIPVGGKELELVNLIDIIQEAIEKSSPKRIVINTEKRERCSAVMLKLLLFPQSSFLLLCLCSL